MESAILKHNLHWKQPYEDLQNRDVLYDIINKLHLRQIHVLKGIRRSGKTTVFKLIINHLLNKIEPKSILYINLDDPYFSELYSHSKNLYTLLELSEKLTGVKVEYLFLDEVQVVDNWELYVRRIYDTENIHIYVTGSSAKLLSTEIATSLRGRTITYEIFPFSFKEYLQYKEIKVNLHSSKSLSFIKNALEAYLVDGGFAETINEEPPVARKILSDYLELIVYKDIVDRYNIKNRSLLKHLNKYCFTNIATLVSFTKLFNEFKSQGYKLGKDTIFDYISYLEDAYTLFPVPIYRNSVKEEQRNPKKVYAIDNGFKKIYDYAIGDDMGKLYENIVFLHLRRQTKDIYYFKEKQEVDFYAKINTNAYLVNVSYKIDDPATRKREIDGLVEAMNYFKLSKAYLITSQEDQIIEIDNKKIYIIPLFRWLLSTYQCQG